jgi:uncharacterized protein (DUF1800 family)
VKSPVEYAIGIIRCCELFDPPPDLVDLEIDLTRMGQRLFYPPSVAGWPGGLAWLGGQEVVARVNFVARVTAPARRGDRNHFDVLARRYGVKSSKSWIDTLATLLLGAPLGPRERPVGELLSRTQFDITRWLLSRPVAQLA